jgi:16S rRNA (cytosine1402-N4)-methyltransferase
LNLGLSSDQLNDPTKSFSFQSNAFLDMRMDPSGTLTAFEVVNQYSEAKLADVIYQFGEERKSRQIAKRMVEKRRSQVLKTTQDIVDIVIEIFGTRRGKIHPATKTFQALRIEVNQELENLKVGLSKSISHVRSGGRIGVISFHSLEDRIVKQQFLEWKKSGIVQWLTQHVIVASRDEQKENPRSRSAKLRVIKKI